MSGSTEQATITVVTEEGHFEITKSQSPTLTALIERLAQNGVWVEEGTCFIPAARIQRIHLRTADQPDTLEVLEATLGPRVRG